MALDRFSNIKEIQETDGKVRAITWNEADLDILQLDVKNIKPEERPIVEIHLYSLGTENSYVAGGVIDDFELQKGKLHINYGKACQSLGIERGQFEVVVNVYKNLLGSDEQPDLYIKSISDNRREVWIKALPNSDVDVDTYLESFNKGTYSEILTEKKINADGEEEEVVDEDGNPTVQAVIERPLSEDIALNFGDNKIYKIINQKNWNEENDFVVRLYKPLPDEFQEKDNLWTIEQLSDSYVDNIRLSGPASERTKSRKLMSANFSIDPSGGTITETDFKSWNQLLDANTSTSQQIVDRIFSSSMNQSAAGIDYSGFQNFIHFSSATERLANFKYKLGLVEYYDGRIAALQNASGSDATTLQGNVATNQNRRDSILGSFDGFERFLYYEPTSSMFTHHEDTYDDEWNKDGVYRAEGGYLGAKTYRLTSWPKYLDASNKYVLHHTTSSIADTWYTGWYTTASLYDSENNKALRKTIPEHIRLDSNNDQYEVFVNMIGQHFDILYSYIDNLTRIYKPEEQPKLGQTKETLYQVAQSLGWKLENGKQASQLWQYKLGVSSGSGAFATTGSLFSKSDEGITTEVWRRIVNNLPYLLKTKGTTRSVKALMNTYGIPQTLLSIREYGGPKVLEDQPSLIEDRFSYALKFNSASVATEYNDPSSPHGDKRATVQFTRERYSGSIGPWGIPVEYNASLFKNFDQTLVSQADFDNLKAKSVERAPDTIEFRMKPAFTSSMILLSHRGNQVQNVHWNLGIQHTGSYSGSGNYGRLYFETRTFGAGAGASYDIGFSEYVPMYDGEFWNVRLWTQFPFVSASKHTTPTIYFQTQKASDYIDDKIVHRTSGSLFPGSGSNASNALTLTQYWCSSGSNKRLVLGGNTGSGLMTPLVNSGYSGSMQEYREWMEVLDQTAFNLHTTNPTSYVSGLSPTSSYDTLVRHYPFGTDLNAVDHENRSVGESFITSSHPNSTITDFSPPYPDGHNQYATASGFTTPLNAQRGNYEPVEETYYIQGVSLGGNTPRSQKIRLEDNDLIRRLSVKSTAERSRFDRAPIDTNRLGLFYSAADQINKDIFNHIGDVALDDYVGDPDDEYEFEYPDLVSFSKEYWKKFSDKNDINAYMRVFSQFDFALFNQIKQLLPERIDEAMGLLVEPHTLERAKVRLTKQPIVEPLHYRVSIPEPTPTASGVILPLSGSIPDPVRISMESLYHTGSGGYVDQGNLFGKLSGSNGGLPGGDPYDSQNYYIKEINPVDMRPSYTGSQLYAYTVMGPATASRWASWDYGDFIGSGSSNVTTECSVQQPITDKIRLQYSTYLRYRTIQDFKFIVVHKDSSTDGTASFASRLITTKNNLHGQDGDNLYFSGSHGGTRQYGAATDVHIVSESADWVGTAIQEQNKTIHFSGSNYRSDEIMFRNIPLDSRTNITFEFRYENAGAVIMNPTVSQVTMIGTISKVGHNLMQLKVMDQRPSTVFKRVEYFYGTGSGTTKYGRDHFRAISESLGLSNSQSLHEVGYRDDFFAMTENQRYDGCKVIGPGVNVVSPVSAIDQKPVVEIFSTNPNTLIFNDRPNQGNPGKLEVR